MEGDDAEPPARGQTVKDGVEPLVQGIQLGVDRNADGLEGAARRVLRLAALCRGHSGGDDLGQLQRGQDGPLRPRGDNFARDLPGIRLLTVVTQDAGQLLTVQRVDQIRGGGTLLAHAHIERRVGMVREAAGRVVQLVAGHAEIEQGPIDRRDAKLRKDAGGLTEIDLHHLRRQTLEPFGGDCHRIRVLIERDQTSCGQAFGDFSAVTGAAGGAIQIDTGGVDVQPVQTRLQQYGDM